MKSYAKSNYTKPEDKLGVQKIFIGAACQSKMNIYNRFMDINSANILVKILFMHKKAIT